MYHRPPFLVATTRQWRGKFDFDGVQIAGNITSRNALHLIRKWAILNKAALDANWSKIKALKQDAYFRRFFVEGGTVAWPNGADIAPETLYEAAVAAQSNPQQPTATPAGRRRG